MQTGEALPRHRLTVRKYHEMAEAGILTERDRVELIDGELIDMTPIGSKHAYCVDRLNQLFVRQAGEGCLVRIQNPIQLGEYGEPEPDLAVVRNRDYSSAHPGPSDVLLIVEVADRSLSYDREIKVPLYALYGIPEVWLIDLPAERVEIRREPKEGRYLQSDEIRSGPLSPSRTPEIVLDVSDLWTVSKV